LRCQLTKHRILYVEDHDDTRDLLTLVLEGRDYEVASAGTIAAALQMARQQHFDLVILDSWLPDGSGVDLCVGIREFNARTPIIFYSAAAYEADRILALAAGAQGYLTKPARLNELCDLVSSLIHASLTNKNQILSIEDLPDVRSAYEPEN
jgi:DNA-binding response OmpR family regulator